MSGEIDSTLRGELLKSFKETIKDPNNFNSAQFELYLAGYEKGLHKSRDLILYQEQKLIQMKKDLSKFVDIYVSFQGEDLYTRGMVHKYELRPTDIKKPLIH